VTKSRNTSRSDRQQLEEFGYAVIPEVLTPADVSKFKQQLDQVAATTAGTRKLLHEPWCRRLAEQLKDARQLQPLIPVDAVAVQCTSFVKSLENNWLVALHQDLSIPVAARVNSSRCSGWTEKESGLFVQPPILVLENSLAVRIHLDDCDERNGALRVLPASHRLGRLSPHSIGKLREQSGEKYVPVLCGGAMLMRPLLCHASSKVSVSNARRVLHFVFGPQTLPEGLQWPLRQFGSGAAS